MQRALKIRRRLAEAGAALATILAIGAITGVRSARTTREMSGWVLHTQQVLSEAASVRLGRARMQNDLWAYRSTPQRDLADRYRVDRAIAVAALRRLEALTSDNAPQQKMMSRISTLLQFQVGELNAAMDRAEANAANGSPQELRPVLMANDDLAKLMDEFEVTERQLFAARSEAVSRNTDLTLYLLVLTGFLGCSALVFGCYYIQREIVTRAQVEMGLKKARELMGAQLSQQQTELHEAVDDLHRQIVARNQAEERMRQLNAELEARVAQRTTELREMNRELESFNYSVSHDLRAPLRHMDGFSRILEDEFARELPTEARHYLGRIRIAAKQMSNLVDDLLQLARFGRQAVKKDKVTVGALVDEVIASCSLEDEDREVVWKVGQMPEVEADEGLLRQVYTNLVTNAVKFTRKKNPTVIEIGCERSETEWAFFVRDNGAGFDPQYSEKLFGVFQRLHRQDEFEGTGIGLAIVARIVHKHGGRVWAESEPDQGATFYFTLPNAREVGTPALEAVGAHG